jgi:polyribonucleotide nucleotidyltransferase
MQAAINAINELVEVAGKPEWDWQAPARNEALIARVAELAEAELREAYRITSKQARTVKCREITKKTIAALTEGVENAPDSNLVGKPYSSWKPRSCAARSSTASRASTAAIPAPCVRS